GCDSRRNGSAALSEVVAGKAARSFGLDAYQAEGGCLLVAVIVPHVNDLATLAGDLARVKDRAALPAAEHTVADLEGQRLDLVRGKQGLVAVVEEYVDALALDRDDDARIPVHVEPAGQDAVPFGQRANVHRRQPVVALQAYQAEQGRFFIAVVIMDVNDLAIA